MIPGEEVEPQPPSFSSLPEEFVESSLARISKWNYPQVSLISKRFRSILSSPSLYKARSLIGTTEPCLYFCLKPPEQPSPNWFTLWKKPPPDDGDGEATRDNDDLRVPDCDYSLVHVPSYSYAHDRRVPIVAVGSEIYSIGGSECRSATAVRILDCRSHTWRDGPDMLVPREDASAVLLDEKIYVMGGCEEDEPVMEVLDIKTQTWRALSSHGSAELGSVFDDWFRISAVNGKINVIGHTKDYAYDPKEDTWEVVGTHSEFKWWIGQCCVIDNVMYCYRTEERYIAWYDPKSREWREVMGPDLKMLHRPISGLGEGFVLGMVGHGGKLVVMWDPYLRDWGRDGKGRKKTDIWCAKIALEKRNGGDEVWGKLEWLNTVLTLDMPYNFVGCVVVSI